MKPKGKPLIFLHGWGSSSLNLKKPIKILSKDFLVFSPDLPGFGKTTPPQKPWKVSDYARFILEFAQKQNLKKFFLIGHSFGGRVAIKMAAKSPKKIEKLCLCNASGVGRPSFSKRLPFYILAKLGKLLFSIWPFCFIQTFARKLLYKLAREKDYLQIKGKMRQTFKNVIAEDQSKEAKKIKVPTLILWAERDKQTPLALGKKMHSLINNSQLIIIPNATHGLPFLEPKTFARHVLAFFKK